MSTAELRAAAERLRNKKHTLPYDIGYYNSDRGLVVKAYLAEHQSEDDEPVTESWLSSIGFRVCEHCLLADSCGVGPIYTLELDLNGGCDGATIWQGDFCISILMPETRGAVRRLCAALGVELKEQQGRPAAN